MLKFFTSQKTYLWVAGVSIGVFLMGSLYIPRNLAVFSGINDMPLLQWLSLNNQYFNALFWIYLLVGLMLLLWICTGICSIDAVIRRTTLKRLIHVLSPQVLHIAILFILLGHGLSAYAGYKIDIPMDMGNSYERKGFELRVDNIDFFKNPGENSTRWRIYLAINNDMHVLETGKPAFYEGVGFFARSAQKNNMKAVIGLVRDPGVLWEIIGAVTFVIGASGICYVRLKEPA
jgi:hypothetical protein